MNKKTSNAKRNSIPSTLNLALLWLAIAGMLSALWMASNTSSWEVAIISAVVFAFLGNTNYALMHEAVHKHFHHNAKVNEIAGRASAAMFPTAFSLQRAFHLSHHRNNRSEKERFDYYEDSDNRLLKYAQWYCILTGLYWLLSPLVCLFYLFTAELMRSPKLALVRENWFARQTSAEEFWNALETVSIWSARRDILITIFVQILLFYVLGLSIWGWIICYAAFAFVWSSLQYTDHAYSELDEKEGAWNLRVSKLTSAIFLNYHCHLAHHRDPSIPWRDLPKSVKKNDPNPSFWEIYWQMWRGPRRLPRE